MARGGGGGGRGGGGGFRGGSHGRSGGYSRPMTTVEKILFVPLMILIFIITYIGEYSDNSRYSETKLEAFCESQYHEAFQHTDSYEDNLLLTFVIYEDRYDYSYMTWVGDHINDETFAYLRGEGTALDDILGRNIGDGYTHTLASDLSFAIRDLADQIDEATEYGSYTCSEGHSENPSGLRNRAAMALNEQLLNDAIDYFREQTGIPLVLVVEDASDIFD